MNDEPAKHGRPTVVFCPIPPPRLLARRLAAGQLAYDEDGVLEKRCSKCGEMWPADTEFFPTTTQPHGPDLHTYCKSCYWETYSERRTQQRQARRQEAA